MASPSLITPMLKFLIDKVFPNESSIEIKKDWMTLLINGKEYYSSRRPVKEFIDLAISKLLRDNDHSEIVRAALCTNGKLYWDDNQFALVENSNINYYLVSFSVIAKPYIQPIKSKSGTRPIAMHHYSEQNAKSVLRLSYPESGYQLVITNFTRIDSREYKKLSECRTKED